MKPRTTLALAALILSACAPRVAPPIVPDAFTPKGTQLATAVIAPTPAARLVWVQERSDSSASSSRQDRSPRSAGDLAGDSTKESDKPDHGHTGSDKPAPDKPAPDKGTKEKGTST